MHAEHPELIKDAYWDTAEFALPYTQATANISRIEEANKQQQFGSADGVT